MSLNTDIANWDGKGVAYIEGVYAARKSQRGFITALARATAEPEQELGATWLLKRALEDGRRLTQEQTTAVYASAPKLKHWQSRLHVLQCMPHAPPGPGDLRAARRFVDACLPSENKFVRAWSLAGAHALAAAYPKFAGEASEIIRDAAENDPAASVRARARILLKAGFPDA